MSGLIVAMLVIPLLVIAVAVVILTKRRGTHPGAGADSYAVFSVADGQLTVLAGLPVTYKLDEIAQITFSAVKAPRSMSSYNGVMRIVKTDGGKSRPFLFNGSAYTKKMALASSKQEIEQAIQYLMGELRRHHIRCFHTQ